MPVVVLCSIVTCTSNLPSSYHLQTLLFSHPSPFLLCTHSFLQTTSPPPTHATPPLCLPACVHDLPGPATPFAPSVTPSLFLHDLTHPDATLYCIHFLPPLHDPPTPVVLVATPTLAVLPFWPVPVVPALPHLHACQSVSPYHLVLAFPTWWQCKPWEAMPPTCTLPHLPPAPLPPPVFFLRTCGVEIEKVLFVGILWLDWDWLVFVAAAAALGWDRDRSRLTNMLFLCLPPKENKKLGAHIFLLFVFALRLIWSKQSA